VTADPAVNEEAGVCVALAVELGVQRLGADLDLRFQRGMRIPAGPRLARLANAAQFYYTLFRGKYRG
jgi:hypothetical protein